MLVSGAQMAPHRRNPEYFGQCAWWRDSDAAHGNQEIFKEISHIVSSALFRRHSQPPTTALTDMESILDNLDPERVLEPIANQKDFDLDLDLNLWKQDPLIHGFVQPQKRSVPTASSF